MILATKPPQKIPDLRPFYVPLHGGVAVRLSEWEIDRASRRGEFYIPLIQREAAPDIPKEARRDSLAALLYGDAIEASDCRCEYCLWRLTMDWLWQARSSRTTKLRRER